MKTRSRKTRLLSFVLSLLIVLTLMPDISVRVYATSDTYNVGDEVTDYLTFTAQADNSSVQIASSAGTFQYQTKAKDAESYGVWSSDSNGTSINLNQGDSVRFKGNSVTFNYYNHVSITGSVACSGDVCSLRLNDSGEFQGLSDSCFAHMFDGCAGLTSAPTLKAATLADGCYYYMFYECRGLISAPALPAMNLADSCYEFMFKNCTGLMTAPDLPATSLAGSCYQSMFSCCTNLTKAPELPATTLTNSCYKYMFDSCNNLTAAPELPATNLANSCYYNMFQGCKNMTSVPMLSATTLASECYYGMFSGCKSLKTAPALPATTLAYGCYNGMFYNCSGLTTAPVLPATVLNEKCYNKMFSGCTGIRLSENKTDEYKYTYTVGQTTANDALDDMFYGTGGTFKGTPVVGKTYYMDSSIYKFNATSTTDQQNKLQYEFTGALGKDITKIEVLMDIESFAQGGWGQVVYHTDGGDDHKKYAGFDTIGIHKYTAEGQVDDITFAAVQLIGKGTLLAYTITFDDNTTVSAGSWSYPTYTAPAAVTGLSYTGSAQELMTADTVTGGTMYYGLAEPADVIEKGDMYTLQGTDLTVGKIFKPSDGAGFLFPTGNKVKLSNNNVEFNPLNYPVYTQIHDHVIVYLDGTTPWFYSGNDMTTQFPTGCDALRIDKINDDSIEVTAVKSSECFEVKTWSTTPPKGTAAGTYTVYYRIDASAGYHGVAATKIADVTIAPVTATVTKAPTAKNPVRENSPVQLINAGEAHTGCTIEYQLGTSATEAPAGTWTTDATQMTANSLGTYYVWYKATGDGKNYTDAAPKCLTVKVTQAQTWTLSMPDYVYDGTAHEPTINGTAYGKLTYTYFTSAGICIGTTAPTEPGDYRVSVAASGDETHPSKLESAYYTIKGAKFAAGNTVSFKEKVEFNFLVEATDADTVEGAYVVFTYDHYGTQTTVKKPINKDDKNGKYYRVRLPLTASEMAIDIKAELYLPTLDKPVDTKTRSIKNYAEAAIKSNLDGAEVLKAMLNYGGYTQTALSNNTTLLANSGEGILTDVSAVSPKSETPFVRPTATEGAKVTYKGSTAMTVSDVYVRHYFAVDSSLTSSELNAVMVKVGDNAPVSITKLGKNNTGYYYDVAPQLAYELDKENGSVVVYGFAGAETADSENAIIIENYNVIDYCEAVANNNKQTTAAKNMAKALYSYYKAAKAYVDSRA